MTRARRILGAAFTALLAGTSIAPAQEQAPVAQEQPSAPAQQQGPAAEVVATHGAWEVRCAEAQEVCVMSQVGKDASGKQVLEIQLRKLSGAKAPDGTTIPAAIQIVTPLGVLLPAGVRIKVDAKQDRAAPYQVCTPEGCVVRQPLSTEFLNELKAGANAKVTLIAPPQQEIPTSISLMGFTDAFEAL